MNEKRLYALRGAVQCNNDPQDIELQVSRLYDCLLESNNLTEEDIVSVIFSQTGDIDAINPASALRNSGRAANLSLFAVMEANAKKALKRVIRILMHCYLDADRKPKHVYSGGAEVLRPDRAN